MTLASKADRLSSYILAAAALVAAGILVEGRFNPPKRVNTQKPRIELLKDWPDQERGVSVPLGNVPSPRVKVVIFTDFQCPFCRIMDSVLTRLEEQNPGKIARSIVHFPLLGHPQALASAVAFQCATEQGRAKEMDHTLYMQQDRLGLIPWAQFAAQAGVADTATFSHCLTKETTDPIIKKGTTLAQELDLRGTPGLVINNWLFDGATAQDIEAAIGAALDGRSPNRQGGEK